MSGVKVTVNRVDLERQVFESFDRFFTLIIAADDSNDVTLFFDTHAQAVEYLRKFADAIAAAS